MNIHYINAFAKQVHSMLIQPIAAREISSYFIVCQKSAKSEREQERAREQSDHAAAWSRVEAMVENPKKRPRIVS